MTTFLNSFSRFFLVFFIISGGFFSAFGQADHDQESGEKLNVSELIIHHVLDDHIWHVADGAVIYLPVIVYSAEKGLDIFSSRNDEEYKKKAAETIQKCSHFGFLQGF